MPKIDLSDSKTCTLIGLLTNLVLMVSKLLAGIFGQSYALIADALNSAGDCLATGTAYFAIRLGEKPADESHPYGHANAETLAALLVAFVILGTGVFIGVSAVHMIVDRRFGTPTIVALVAAIATILVKEGLFRYTIKVGEKSNSPAVIAGARDHRSDVYTSAGVLLGIIGARVAFVYLDPIAGIVIGAWIIRVSIKLFRSNIGILMDESPPLSFLGTVKSTAGAVDGVRAVDDVKVHRRGPVSNVDIEIAVDGKLTVEEGHQIAAAVRSELSGKVQHVRDVMVHVNPYRPDQSQEEDKCDG